MRELVIPFVLHFSVITTLNPPFWCELHMVFVKHGTLLSLVSQFIQCEPTKTREHKTLIRTEDCHDKL